MPHPEATPARARLQHGGAKCRTARRNDLQVELAAAALEAALSARHWRRLVGERAEEREKRLLEREGVFHYSVRGLPLIHSSTAAGRVLSRGLETILSFSQNSHAWVSIDARLQHSSGR